VFWVGTVQHRFRKMECVRFNVVTDVVYPEHGGVRQRTQDAGKGCPRKGVTERVT
jgi:hypothetical protein